MDFQKTYGRPRKMYYPKKNEVIPGGSVDMGMARERRIENLTKELNMAKADQHRGKIFYFNKEIEIQKSYQLIERIYDKGDTTMTLQGNVHKFQNPTGY